jgi:glycosyltransferase involved in cell wall biosynthesis
MKDTSLPLISIITPCLNRANMIETALKSVSAQNYPNVEHIIIDGNSTDGTLQLLANYPDLLVVSKADQGVYDALNKGIQLSHGEIIGQLNTDDYFEENILGEIAEIFNLNPEIDAVVGGAKVVEKDSQGINQTLVILEPVQTKELIYRATIGVPVFNAWFFRKSLFQKVGYYSIKYKIASDRDFLLRMALNGVKFIPVNKVLYSYLQHTGSLSITKSIPQREKYIFESLSIAEYWSHPNISSEQIISACRKWYVYLCRNLLVMGIKTFNLKIIVISLIKFGRILLFRLFR